MDNQQNQSGTPDSTNPGRAAQNMAATPGATSTPRKPMIISAKVPSPAATSNSHQQDMANADTGHQGESPQPNGPEGSVLDTAAQSGRKWIESAGLFSNMNQMPQGLKNLGNRATAKVNELTTTQKVVGGALLAVGLGWLATRKGRSSGSDSAYNYGNPRDNDGNFGRRTAGYQAPDALARPQDPRSSDSGSPYGGGNRYGSPEEFDNGPGFSAPAGPDRGQSSSGHENPRGAE